MTLPGSRKCWACPKCPEVMACTHQWQEATPVCAGSMVMGTMHDAVQMMLAEVRVKGGGDR